MMEPPSATRLTIDSPVGPLTLTARQGAISALCFGDGGP